ncbi:DUF6615 family protein [Streptomyces sp. NPDC021212]|uniref:DUF6615 family protein n=1 Tax=Streptomyces sp. NPDC021212 TaxID=3365118 RepID=UPI0037A11970
MTRSLCRTLRACATRTFERLAHDHFAGPVPGEEAYTQLNLQDLHRLHGDRVIIRDFMRREESRNGADWEWWFHAGGLGFGMRVQAKRAKRGGGYDLEHTVRSTGDRQSELLVNDALAAGCLPVYVLYNHRNWVPTSRFGQAVDCRHGRGEQAQLGCTIVSALTVQSVLRSRPVRAAHVRDQSVPWHRILCDAPSEKRTGLEAAHMEVQHLHFRGVEDLQAAVVRVEHLSDERARARYDTTAEYGDMSDVVEPRRVVEEVHSVPTEADFYRADQDVLNTPVYRGLNVIADRPLAPLPGRVKAMLRGNAAEPPDERAAGAVLVDLAD